MATMTTAKNLSSSYVLSLVAAFSWLVVESTAAAQEPAPEPEASTEPAPSEKPADAPAVEEPVAEPAPAPVAPAPAVAPVEQFKEKAVSTSDAPAENQTTWTLSAGGILNTGNTRSIAASLASRFLVQRSRNMVSGDLQIAYGEASLRDDNGDFGPYQKNTENYNAQARYDRFLTDWDALFLAGRFRSDQFAGIDSRIQGQLGYLRELYKQLNQRLWGEVGYDLTLDNFHPDPLLDPDTGVELDGTQTVHSARLFLGYDNHVTKTLTFLTGVEGLFDVEDRDNVRIQSITEISSDIADNLQFGLNFTLRFDNVPVAGAEKLDTLTTLNLIYSLL